MGFGPWLAQNMPLAPSIGVKGVPNEKIGEGVEEES